MWVTYPFFINDNGLPVITEHYGDSLARYDKSMEQSRTIKAQF